MTVTRLYTLSLCSMYIYIFVLNMCQTFLCSCEICKVYTLSVHQSNTVGSVFKLIL